MKEKLIDFINYFHLNGVNEKVLIKTENDKTKCRCINDDRQVITDVCTERLFDEGEVFGIYELSQFKKFLSLIDQNENTDFSLKKTNDVNSTLQIKNNKVNVKYNLADSSIISAPPDKLKKDPTWHYEIQIDEKDIKYITNALDVTKSQLIQFLVIDDNIVCNIGNLQYKENIVQINLTSKKIFESEKKEINFNSIYFSNIINSTGKGILKLSFDGIYEYGFKHENTECIYLQKSIILNQ